MKNNKKEIKKKKNERKDTEIIKIKGIYDEREKERITKKK